MQPPICIVSRIRASKNAHRSGTQPFPRDTARGGRARGALLVKLAKGTRVVGDDELGSVHSERFVENLVREVIRQQDFAFGTNLLVGIKTVDQQAHVIPSLCVRASIVFAK